MADKNTVEKTKKFSLVELLMIIMVVGIIFTLYIPLREDRINQEKMKEAIRNIQIVAHENVKFYQDPDRGDGFYAFDIAMLDLGDRLQPMFDDEFLFEYSVTDSTVVATTNENFNTKGAVIYYYLPNGPWHVADDRTSREVFNPAWLP